MNPERAIEVARELAEAAGPTAVSAFWLVHDLFRAGMNAAIREVEITAPGVVIEDLRGDGGAVVEDRR